MFEPEDSLIAVLEFLGFDDSNAKNAARFGYKEAEDIFFFKDVRQLPHVKLATDVYFKVEMRWMMTSYSSASL